MPAWAVKMQNLAVEAIEDSYLQLRSKLAEEPHLPAFDPPAPQIPGLTPTREKECMQPKDPGKGRI